MCQRKYPEGLLPREETASPTVSTESTMLTSVIEAYEGRDVATADIPNAFIPTNIPDTDQSGTRTIMKLRGAVVQMLCKMDKEYKEYVTIENGKEVLYTHITKAIYGLLLSAMLFTRS